MAAAIVQSTASLARILGVSAPAIRKAEARGKISRTRGRWDAVACLMRWRATTMPSLQRPGQGREFRPWLDPSTPLTDYIWGAFCRRCAAEGAVWEEYEDGEEWEEDEEG